MRSLWVGIPLVFTVQLAVHAAQPQSAAPTAASPSQAITVTGCLQASAASSGGAAASPANAAATLPAGSTPYVLANASKRAADADGAAGAPTGASASGRAPGPVGTGGTTDVTSYALHGRADELAAHVGHRVEITGTASETAPSAEVAAGAPEQQVIPHEPQRGPVGTVASPEASARTAHPSVQHLSVQSVKMLDATCK